MIYPENMIQMYQFPKVLFWWSDVWTSKGTNDNIQMYEFIMIIRTLGKPTLSQQAAKKKGPILSHETRKAKLSPSWANRIVIFQAYTKPIKTRRGSSSTSCFTIQPIGQLQYGCFQNHRGAPIHSTCQNVLVLKQPWIWGSSTLRNPHIYYYNRN